MARRARPVAGDRCARVDPLLSAWVDDELRHSERTRIARHLQL
ncbi:MAG: zf-HC2 domain-containing protein, partial [Egibacteraceae bacterium]